MSDADEIQLVCLALASGLSNCVEWDESAARNARNNRDLAGFTPEFIRGELLWQIGHGLKVTQHLEIRDGHRDRFRHYYKAILDLEEFRPRGLFVELRLIDEDPEYPVVAIVSVHPQGV